MSDFNFQTPCEDQNLTSEELKKCQQEYKKYLAREKAEKRFRLQLKNTGGNRSKSAEYAFKKRQEEIDTDGDGNITAEETSNFYDSQTGGTALVDGYLNIKNIYNSGEKDNDISKGIYGDIEKIYKSRQKNRPFKEDINIQQRKNKYENFAEALTDDFLEIWKQQEGYEDRYAYKTLGLGNESREKSGYNKALKIWQEQQQQVSNNEIASIYGEEVLQNFLKGSYTTGEFGSMKTVKGLDISLLDQKKIDAKRNELILEETKLLLDPTGERDLDPVLMPALEKYLYTDKDRNKDGLLPNEAIVKHNTEERLRFMELGCGGSSLADSIPLGKEITLNCRGKEHTFKLKEFQSKEEIYETFQEGQQQLKERSEALSKEITKAQSDAAPLLKTVNDLKTKLENYGEITPLTSPRTRWAYQQDVKDYQNAIEAYNGSEAGKELERLAGRTNLLNAEYDALEAEGVKLDDYGILLEAGSLNYNLLDKTFATLNAQFVAPVQALVGSIDNALGKLFDKDYSDANLKSSMNYYKMAQEDMANFATFGSDHFGLDGFGFGRYLLNLAADNSFSIGATLLPGGFIGGLGGRLLARNLTGAAQKAAFATANKMAQSATMATFFVSGSGDQWGKLTLASMQADEKLAEINKDLLNEELTPEMKEQLMSDKQFYESQKNLKYGGAQRAFAAILYGGMDMIGERLGSLRVISNLQKVGSSYARQGILKSWRKSQIEGIKATLTSGYRFGAGIGSELLEESFVNLGTAFVDRNILGIDTGYLDGFSTDFALNTAFTSIALQSPYMANNVMSGVRYELMSNADRKAMRKIHGDLMSITTKLENGKLDGSLSSAEIKELQDQKQDLFEQATVSDFLSMNSWTKLDQKSRNQLIEIGSELRAAEKDLYSLTSDPQFGQEGFLEEVTAAEKRVEKIDAKKAELLKSKKLSEYNQAEADFLKANPDAQLANSTVAKARVQVYEAALDIAGFQYDGTTDVLTDPESVEAFIEQNKDRLSDKDIEGIRNESAFVDPATGNLVVNQQNIYESIMTGTTSQALTAAIAPLHELMHAQIKATKLFDAKNSPELQENINTATIGLTDVLKSKMEDGSLDSKRGQELLDRIDQYDKSNIEEVMTVFSEALLLGDIKGADMNAMYGLKNMLNSVWGQFNPTASNVLNPFKTTNDIYSFVTDFAQKTANIQSDKVQQVYTMDSTGRTKYESGLVFSKGDAQEQGQKVIPPQYDIDRIETNLELNKEVGNVFVRENNRKDLEAELARAKEVQRMIDERSPDELRQELELAKDIGNVFSRKRVTDDIKYALEAITLDRRGPDIDPLTGDPKPTQAPKGIAFSINPTKIAENLAGKGLEVSEKQINDMVGKIASRATTKFWSRMSASNQNIVPRKLYKDSAKNLLLEIANNYRREVSKNTGKQVTFDAYMANTGMQRLNSLAADLGAKQKDDKSLSDEATLRKAEQKQQTTEETTVAKPGVTPTTEIFDVIKSINPDINVKDFEKKFTEAALANAKKQGLNISDPNLTPKQRAKITPYDVLAEALGIDPKKISNPAQNLNQDAKKVQRFLFKASQLIKTAVLSKAYTDVQTVASKVKGGKPVKVGGTTLGYGKDLLNEFFNEPKRLGSGKYVRSPKQWSKARYEQAIGIKDGKIDPNYVARKEQEQMMKAMLKALAEQMALRATSRVLDTKAPTKEITLTQAQLDSMKSPLLFSKAPSNIKTKIPKFKKDANGKKQYKEFLQQKLFPLFPKSFFLQGGDSALQFLESKFQYFSKKEIDAIIKEQGNNFGKPFPKGVNLKYINKRYNQIFPKGWDSMLEMHNSGDLKAMNDSNSKLGKVMWGRIYKAIRTAVDANDQNFLQGLQSYMAGVGSIDNHPLKMIAPVVGGTFGYQKGKENVTYEHARPATDTYNVLVNAAIAYKSKTSFDKVYNEMMKNYKVIALSKVDAEKVDAVYKLKMPEGVTEWFRRYANPKVALENGGVDVNNLYLFDQGKVFSDAFNMDAAGKPLTKEGKVVAKAATKKYKTLDNGLKFSLSPKGKKAIDNLKNNQPEGLSKDFNDIIEQNKGIKSEARFSEIVAKRRGRGKGRFRFFIPPGAEDFKGLLYNFLGKGRKGEQQWQFLDKNLLKPYWQAISQIERARRALKGDYSTLLKGMPAARKKLGTKIPTKGKTAFTYDHAVRAYLMDQSGYDLVAEAGLSKRDAKILVDAIAKDQTMLDFAQGLQMITKQDVWVKPTSGFDIQTIQSDIHRFTSGEGRKKFLDNSGFMQNVDQIFSTENLRKIEAAYGTNLREALEDTIYRMKNGTNRQSGTNRLTNTFNNWINRSVGAIMFFNRKSALLQTISSVNFINWSDNNPLKAGIAFANQKQYWKDFAFIFNSPKLKERRAGLKGDINEAELADAVRGATNKAEAALSWLLKQGFLPTQMADSFAIASGGATFYRNRINTYLKQGMNQQAAEKKAWEDFSRISEESQQSADPAMISEQQASPLGRFTLNFQNTPMQYTRLMKRAGQDLINRRRIPGMTQAQSDATYISKIIYYGAIQNFIFSALQNALFAVIPGFGGDEDEEELTTKEQMKRKKELKIANGMIDTILRGTGVYGAIAATIKNTAIKYYENEGKDPFAKDNADILIEAANLSPVVGSKLRKLNNALKTKEFEKDVIEERGWEITRDGRLNLSPSYNVLGSTTEALLNIPLERTMAEIDALVEMTDQRNSSLERIALALGWRTWDIGVPNEEEDQIKIDVKEQKKQERKDKLRREREEKKRLEEEKRFEGKTDEEIELMKTQDEIRDLTKAEQVNELSTLGLSKKDIRALRLEEDRINKIIELREKKKAKQ